MQTRNQVYNLTRKRKGFIATWPLNARCEADGAGFACDERDVPRARALYQVQVWTIELGFMVLVFRA